MIQRPESPLKQARTDSVPTASASLPRQTLSAAPLHTRVCALRTHICACEDSSQRHCRLCFSHTYDIALLRLFSVARYSSCESCLEQPPSRDCVAHTSGCLQTPNPRTSDPTGR
ncbi:hypothetical protein KC19_2G261700 [Ceratodon purpureus]|uniref:Uncharacterized protein n=1 Tax=Ceratodon purpureus TaxID=3225 RepID=A0A8T0IZL8_CERPU|nr:hypothetical protein KC19_2G261700 [Ceratodon purpureus]